MSGARIIWQFVTKQKFFNEILKIEDLKRSKIVENFLTIKVEADFNAYKKSTDILGAPDKIYEINNSKGFVVF